jgi:hypothetical protein
MKWIAAAIGLVAVAIVVAALIVTHHPHHKCGGFVNPCHTSGN